MKLKQLYFPLVILLMLGGCNEKYTPKPRGFFRIDFPEKEYKPIKENYPYSFEIPVYSDLLADKDRNAGQFDSNIDFPENNAKIHITYKEIMPGYKSQSSYQSDLVRANNFELAKLLEESRKFAYDHTIKADAIDEKIYMNHNERVYGTIYFIEGNAASSVQFYLTDSVKHFLRGALYLNEVPNIDSIQPVIDFIRPDIIHLIETTSWN